MPKTMMQMPALAVVGPDRRIVRSTETFRRRYANAESLCETSPELDQVLTGRADMAKLNVGDVSLEIEAVTDAEGTRQAMLILPVSEPVPSADAPWAALREECEESPAIVWVKDLGGHYLFANQRFIGDLGTSEERLLGKTDADLPETETADGPRHRVLEDGLKEALQLEYTVPAVANRPALAVFRFALRDENDQPIATCGVAAPVSEAQTARDEGVRLMQLERWHRLDPVDVRAELLEQWHVHATAALAIRRAGERVTCPTWDVVARSGAKSDEPVSRPTEAKAAKRPAPSPTAPAEPAVPSLSETAELMQTNLELARTWASRAAEVQQELRQAQAAAARASEEASRWRGELELAQRELERLQTAERERNDELERALAWMRSGLSDLETVLDSAAVAA